MTLAERFWAKVDKSDADGCWLWTATLISSGYGRFRVGRRLVLAHRVAYELTYGPIPDGLTIDHVRSRGCVHRHCVNPAHLEAVTQRENVLRGEGRAAQQARQTHCKRGHPLSGANLYVRKYNGSRACNTCRRDRVRAKAVGK